MKTAFTRNLIDWHYATNKRIMPWKGEKDPYKIWLSEIILQQTRVEQGLSYFNTFVSNFPTIFELAAAHDDHVFKLWEGLGYYNRCKNLLFTARHLVSNYDGRFPTSYDELLKLKGVGPYTAAAISSFAFGLPVAVLDGNVFRVLSRYFGVDVPIESKMGKHTFLNLAKSLLSKNDSATFNQAIMDFGATVCKPQVPLCDQCVLRAKCIALNKGLIGRLPVKEKRLQKKSRWFNYFIFSVGGKILVSKRTAGDIWQNLHEFYLYESTQLLNWDETSINKWLASQLKIKSSTESKRSHLYRQQLTHQTINGQFIHVQLSTIPTSLQHLNWLNPGEMKLLPFPRMINLHLESFK